MTISNIQDHLTSKVQFAAWNFPLPATGPCRKALLHQPEKNEKHCIRCVFYYKRIFPDGPIRCPANIPAVLIRTKAGGGAEFPGGDAPGRERKAGG
jgi:hypothetical protein